MLEMTYKGMANRHRLGKVRDGSGDRIIATGVTAKMATPTKVDSKLTDAQLESRRRATEALRDLGIRAKPLRLRRLEAEVRWIAKDST
jgi:hypothetical protein